MTTAMEQIAHRQATRATAPEMAAFMQDLFGQQLTAYMTGIRDGKAVGQWARGEREPHTGTAKRLRTAYQIARLLLQVDSAQIVQAWFMGMNPLLDDEAPARLLVERPARVMQAARYFMSSG